MSNSPGYEKSGALTRFIFGAGLVVVIGLVVMLFFLNKFFTFQKERLIAEVFLAPQTEELMALHAQETGTLTTYGVVDAEQGVYRIPINRAMELMAANAAE